MNAWMWTILIPLVPLIVMTIYMLIRGVIDFIKSVFEFNVWFYEFVAHEIKGLFKKRGTQHGPKV